VSKSGNKQQRNACSNYAPLEHTALRTQSVTNKQTNQKTNTTFSHLQPARIVRSSPLCMVIELVMPIIKGVIHFLDPTHSFSYRVHGKIWPNLQTRIFSAITP